MKHIDQVF